MAGGKSDRYIKNLGSGWINSQNAIFEFSCADATTSMWQKKKFWWYEMILMYFLKEKCANYEYGNMDKNNTTQKSCKYLKNLGSDWKNFQNAIIWFWKSFDILTIGDRMNVFF